MNKGSINVFSKNKIKWYMIIITIIIIYLFISIYFNNHFFFNTQINGINISLKSYDEANDIIQTSIRDYKLVLIEREGRIEEILGKDIELKYNKKNTLSNIKKVQFPLKWGKALFKEQNYYVEDLIIYNKDNLEDSIKNLKCLNENIIEPKNVGFKYLDGSYNLVEEVYGNKVNEERLYEIIEKSILKGYKKLDLNESLCYENPKYTLSSDKTIETKNILDKYISTKITYLFGSKSEVLDGDLINKWLSINDELDVVIDKKLVKEYVSELGKKYNTVGITRSFKTSVGKTVEVNGGYYGWKINVIGESKVLLENIKFGAEIEKEPSYTQKALYRDGDDIGNTYVEVNITKQHLWFYKNGQLITQGDIVTGNINRGYATNLGVYGLNYKQKEATLKGVDYETEVDYWMPFNGNIGLHDASWRNSFGGNIYISNGSHGCINLPKYLAKTIFENIEAGTPIICYEE